MAIPTRAEFETRFPQFTNTQLDSYYLSNANTYTCYFNFQYATGSVCNDESILLVIAHLITLDIKSATSSNSTKTVSSKSVEGVSVTYSVPQDQSEMNAFFSTTSFGQKFLQINQHKKGACFV